MADPISIKDSDSSLKHNHNHDFNTDAMDQFNSFVICLIKSQNFW